MAASTPHSASCFYTFDRAVHTVTLGEPPQPDLHLPEALVQDLWKTQRFDHSALATYRGEPIHILHPGRLNTESGPDFTAARLRIGEMEWAGDVEIHLSSSGWQAHRHDRDDRYSSVVLHVVLHADLHTGCLHRADGTTLPELVLYPHLETPLRRLLHQFYTTSRRDILCAAQWNQVPEAVKNSFIHQLARERLESKKQELARRCGDASELERLLQERVYAGLGYANNAEPMSMLARRLPLSTLRSYEDPTDLEALHFGTAGLLPTPEDLLESDRSTADYAVHLKERFHRLNQQLERRPMERTLWQFFRLRPANFPTLRIAQASALLHPGSLLHHDPLERLSEAFIQPRPKRALRALFNVRLPDFWHTHLHLHKTTKPYNPAIGKSRTDTLLVNAAAPVMLQYARQKGRPALEQAVLDLLQNLPGPTDRITRRFKKLGSPARDALTAQGQHQLYRTRCKEARCLTCPIGQHLLA